MNKQTTIIFKKHIKKTPIILAISGGVDSMVLLDICKDTFEKNDMRIVHINHKVRKESTKDKLLIENYCEKHDLDFTYKELSFTENERKTEEILRKKRYEILEEQRLKHKAQYIITAHHLDDKIETFIFRMIRGSSLNGLLSPKLIDGSIFRPLLNASKDEIIKYANDKQLKWNEDITNKDTTFSRNSIRHEILPLFNKIHESSAKNIKTLLEDLQKWDDFHKTFIEKWMKKHPLPFTCDSFLELPDIIQKELLSQLVRPYGEILSRGHLKEILKIIRKKDGNKFVALKNGLEVFINGKKIGIRNIK